jgi:hypothetical protein
MFELSGRYQSRPDVNAASAAVEDATVCDRKNIEFNALQYFTCLVTSTLTHIGLYSQYVAVYPLSIFAWLLCNTKLKRLDFLQVPKDNGVTALRMLQRIIGNLDV